MGFVISLTSMATGTFLYTSSITVICSSALAQNGIGVALALSIQRSDLHHNYSDCFYSITIQKGPIDRICTRSRMSHPLLPAGASSLVHSRPLSGNPTSPAVCSAVEPKPLSLSKRRSQTVAQESHRDLGRGSTHELPTSLACLRRFVWLTFILLLSSATMALRYAISSLRLRPENRAGFGLMGRDG